MSKSKYYAVRKGKKTGVYLSWIECQEQTSGFPGADFKSFLDKEEAERYVLGDIDESTGEILEDKLDDVKNTDYELMVSNLLKEEKLVIFTDGGYSSKKEVSAWGAYILDPNSSKPIEINDIVRTDRFDNSNNIGPEIMAVINALDWSLSNGFTEVVIFHDYEGIGKWGRGEWNAKSDIAKWYLEKLRDVYNDIIDVTFVWVPGHAGIFYNEEADRLATEAMNRNVNPTFKFSETYFTSDIVGERDFVRIMDRISESLDIENDIKIDESTGDRTYRLSNVTDKLVIKFYRRKSKVLVQGKQSALFSIFMTFYTEEVSDYEMIVAYGNMHKQRIEIDDVDKLFQNLSLPKDYPSDGKKLLKQSISEKIAMENGNKNNVEDYGHYVFPACRSLECHLKFLLEKSGVHVGKKNNGKDQLVGEFFEMKSDKHVVKGKALLNSPYVTELENTYSCYVLHRHRLGHFGELTIGNLEESDTYMIEEKEVAIDIIDDILDLITFQ